MLTLGGEDLIVAAGLVAELVLFITAASLFLGWIGDEVAAMRGQGRGE